MLYSLRTHLCMHLQRSCSGPDARRVDYPFLSSRIILESSSAAGILSRTIATLAIDTFSTVYFAFFCGPVLVMARTKAGPTLPSIGFPPNPPTPEYPNILSWFLFHFRRGSMFAHVHVARIRPRDRPTFTSRPLFAPRRHKRAWAEGRSS